MAWQYQTHSSLGFYTFNATAGCTYQFTYCNSIAPSASYSGDPYITVATGPVSGALTTNDDYCGLGSYLSWTAPSTGLFYFNVGNCCSPQCGNISPRTFGYRSTNCAGGVTPPTSITASAATICAGQSVTLTANGAMGTQFWYTGSCGGTQVGTGATLTVSPNTTTTYYVNNNSGGQFSPSCATITITVNPSPQAPSVNGNLVLCGPGSTVLTASGGLATYNWYANAAGSTLLGTGASFTTPVLNTTTTYYVNTQQAGNFGVGSQTFNFTGGPQSFTAPVTGTYTFDLYGARGGNVTSYYPTNGGLGGRAQGTTTLNAGQVINVYVGGQGQDRMGNHPYGNCAFVPGGWNGGGANRSAGNGTPGGGASDIRVGGNALANRIIVAGGGGGCGWSYAAGGHGGGLTGNNGTNSPNSGGTQVAGGAIANGGGPCGVTAGSLGQGGDGSGWSAGGGGGGGGFYGGGGGGYNNGGGGGSSYVGGVNGGTTTTGVQNGNGQIIISWNAQGCPSPLTPVTVTINPLPVVTATGATICSGQTATLTATANVPGGTFTWNPGNLTGSSVTVTPNTTTQYTVSYSVPNCNASTATATVTVNPSPAAPTANNVTLCGPGTATLTATGGQNNSYVWYSNANGTGQLSTNASYTTPTISTTTTYYVGTAAQGGAVNGTQTFNYTGGIQTFTAPVTGNYTVTLFGAQGGNGLNTTGGLGGQATGSLALTAGQTISVYVGGKGGNAGGVMGWNGGGQGGLDVGAGQHAGSGGGATDIRVGGAALANRVIVAGGGAGGGRDATTGVGGGTSGTTSANFSSGYGGTGGTQVGGGLAWTLVRGATHGTLGQGGNGSTGYNAAGGGGGGGGYYGGGGGTSTQNHGSGWSAGGGGGSSFLGGVTAGSTTQGVRSNDGLCTITWAINAIGCPSALTPVTVTVNPVPVVTVTNATVCAGQQAILTATSTVPGGTFTWSPGGTTGATITVTPNTTTTYTATYTVAGCPPVTGTGTVTINPLQPITGTLSACLGLTSQLSNAVTPGTWSSSNTGVATISASGLVTGVSAGTSTITYNASNGCSTTSQFTVFPQPVLTATPSNVLCFGGTGSVSLSAVGANAPYTYGGSPTQNLQPGTYTYTATSVDGCVSAPVSVTITQPQAALALSSTQVNVLCSGNNTGSINLTVTGGTAPYTYAWSNNTTLEDPTGLASGAYTVTVTDANGCTATTTVTITQPSTLTSSYTQVNVGCFGNTTGSIDLTVNGGVAPYVFAWSNQAITEDLNNIPSGVYTVTATDANGCTTTQTVTITQPQAALALSTTQVNVLCFGNSTGSVNLTVTGGTAPYNYLWSNNGTAEDPTGMPSGAYTVTVTDANGCTAQTSVTITQPQAALALSSTQVNVLCFGNSTGSVNLTVTGGTAPYTYAWSNNTTLQDPTGLAAGTYTVTVTDANGCTATATVTITEPASAVSVTTQSQNILCLNGTGSVNSTPTGGVAPYTYSWTNNALTQNITNLQAGSYTVTVQDANGCTAQSTGTVLTTLSPLPVQILNITGTTILTCTNPTIMLQATGGVTYNWSGGSTPLNDTNSITQPGLYTVNMVDPNGCPVSQTITLTQNITPPTPGITNITGTTIIDCNAPSIDLQATGGGTYQWNNNLGASANVNITQAGTYTVVVTAANGCQDSSTVAITVAPVPAVTANDTTICSGQSVTLTPIYFPAGGQAVWTNGQLTPSVTVSPNTTTMYSVLYTWNGCTATDDITVTVNPTPTVSVNNPNICFGDTTLLTATPNLPNGVYNWITANETTQSISVSPQVTTTYDVEYTLNGCTSAIATSTVTVTPLPIITVPDIIICDGATGTLTATANVAGGTYTWSQGGTTASIMEGPQTTTSYNVSYTVNGCTSNTESPTITVNPLPNVSFTADTTSGCVPVVVNLSADTTGQQASYTWSSNGGGGSVGANAQMNFGVGGCYDVTLTATLNGCSYSVTQPDFVCVQDYPQANFEANPPSFTESTQVLNFNNSSIGATGYVWNFGDGNVSNQEYPEHLFQGTNDGYTITLIASTSMGCMDSTSITISANLGEVYYIPNSFTPDGDKYNQIFKPVVSTGISSDGYEMLIFNRWGEIMFESKNINVGWDGSYGSEGLDCPSGTYTYKISFTLIGGLQAKSIVTGHVNLLR
jgi:gliding motility-associated-like protein